MVGAGSSGFHRVTLRACYAKSLQERGLRSVKDRPGGRSSVRRWLEHKRQELGSAARVPMIH